MAEDLWDRLLDTYFPYKFETILNLVDEYTLFCYYMEEDVLINQVILSPLRDPAKDKEDTAPSFVIYETTTGLFQLRFFDFGKGDKGGNIFDFVKELYGLKTIGEAVVKITKDFELGLFSNTDTSNKKTFLESKPWSKKQRVQIKDVIPLSKFTSEGINYWKQYYITPEILEEYNVKQISSVVTDVGIISVKDSIAFSYRIGTKHKIYQPFNKELKFRNNYPSTYVEGYYQLVQRIQKSNILFITKSTKDIMVLRALGLDAVAPKAENILIPEFIQIELRKMYKHIVTLFDDDPAGQKGSSKYSYPRIWIPINSHAIGEVKDISDYIKVYGPEATKQLLFNLLTNGSRK